MEGIPRVPHGSRWNADQGRVRRLSHGPSRSEPAVCTDSGECQGGNIRTEDWTDLVVYWNRARRRILHICVPIVRRESEPRRGRPIGKHARTAIALSVTYVLGTLCKPCLQNVM